MKAVDALRAELEEEEQELGGAQAASVSEDAQSDKASSQAVSESESVQHAAAAGAGAGDADSDADPNADQDHVSPPDLTCTLTTSLTHTTQTILHRLNDAAANIPQQYNVTRKVVSLSMHQRICMDNCMYFALLAIVQWFVTAIPKVSSTDNTVW